jgi:CRP/FNR family transcriptional regulator
MLDDKRGGFVPCEECFWRRTSMFVPIGGSDLAALKAFKKDHVHVPAGRTLIRRDSKPAVFYTLYDGWAFQYMTVNAGRQILHFCLPGDLVALQVPFYGRAPYNVQTLTDASLCVFETDKVERLFEAHPRLGYALARIAATEAALMDAHLATIGRRNAEARVAYLLCELYSRLKHRRMARENSCVLPLTQEHIADALGLSTVHVSRMLKAIYDDGLARLDRGQLTIYDFAGLCTRAELNTELDIPKPSLF